MPLCVHLEGGLRQEDQIMNPCKVLTQPPASCEHHRQSPATWAPPDNGLDQRALPVIFSSLL